MSGIRWYIPFLRPRNFVRVVRLQGALNANSQGARALNLKKVDKALEAAFNTKKAKPRAVCLEINSMGGSAVQSNLIYQRIRALSQAGGIPVLSFTEDAALSGGYWLAAAGDEIFVDANSMVGSIGALYAGFGYTEAIKKLGIEWRLVEAGENKMRMDPFKPLKTQDVEWIKNITLQIHQNFISLVKERRPQIDVNHKTVFTGDIFTGKDAVEIGLADRVASDLKAVCQEKYGKDVVFQRCEPHKSFYEKFAARGFGTQARLDIDDALDSLEIKQLEAKNGL